MGVIWFLLLQIDKWAIALSVIILTRALNWVIMSSNASTPIRAANALISASRFVRYLLHWVPILTRALPRRSQSRTFLLQCLHWVSDNSFILPLVSILALRTTSVDFTWWAFWTVSLNATEWRWGMPLWLHHATLAILIILAATSSLFSRLVEEQ